jgi:protein-tyrosine-phosphatase
MDKKGYSKLARSAFWLGYMIALIASVSMPLATLAKTITSVYIVTTPGSNYQMRVANTLVEKLSSSGIDAKNITASKLDKLAADNDTMFVTFDGSTSGKLKQLFSANPQLHITYNNTHIKPPVAENQSVFVLTQSACRQIIFMQKLVPTWKSAGIITSKTSSKQLDDIKQCGTQHGITIRIYHVNNEKDLIQNLDNAVIQNDVLLALADTVVYNSRSVKNILLTAYRHRKPVIGYSNSLVKAGAVAAIYTSAEDAGVQAAEIIEEYNAAKGCFGRRIFTPSTFTVSINRQVARALDIDLGEHADFSDDLDLLEIR